MNNDVSINGRFAFDINPLDEAAAASLCTRSTGTGGFGTRGTSTLGVSKRNGNASGCNSGKAITTAATATCKPIDPNVVHRLLEETSKPRDSTRLSSNMEAPSNLRIQVRI
jgi:hypothetical protein